MNRNSIICRSKTILSKFNRNIVNTQILRPSINLYDKKDRLRFYSEYSNKYFAFKSLDFKDKIIIGLEHIFVFHILFVIAIFIMFYLFNLLLLTVRFCFNFRDFWVKKRSKSIPMIKNKD